LPPLLGEKKDSTLVRRRVDGKKGEKLSVVRVHAEGRGGTARKRRNRKLRVIRDDQRTKVVRGP